MTFDIRGYTFTLVDHTECVTVEVSGLIEKFPTGMAALTWIYSFGAAL